MWYPGEIVLKSYNPFTLEKGMLFVNRISVGIMEPYVELWVLEEIPEDKDVFMAANGAPVELLIIGEEEQYLATEIQIGWWDEGEHTDELRDITIDDINLILREYDGWLAIEMDEDGITPNLFEGKVILTLDQEDSDLEPYEIELEEIKRIEKDNE